MRSAVVTVLGDETQRLIGFPGLGVMLFHSVECFVKIPDESFGLFNDRIFRSGVVVNDHRRTGGERRGGFVQCNFSASHFVKDHLVVLAVFGLLDSRGFQHSGRER